MYIVHATLNVDGHGTAMVCIVQCTHATKHHTKKQHHDYKRSLFVCEYVKDGKMNINDKMMNFAISFELSALSLSLSYKNERYTLIQCRMENRCEFVRACDSRSQSFNFIEQKKANVFTQSNYIIQNSSQLRLIDRMCAHDDDGKIHHINIEMKCIESRLCECVRKCGYD